MRYRWDNPASLLREVDLFQPNGDSGALEAVIYPPEGAMDKAGSLPQFLHQQGLSFSAGRQHGRDALFVEGIKDRGQFIGLLQGAGLIAGEAKKEAIAEDTHQKAGLLENVRSKGLQISGVFYLLGNVASMWYGWKVVQRQKEINALRGTNEKVNYGALGTGAAFMLGDIPMALFGHKSETKQYREVLDKLRAHLNERGIVIPQGSAVTAEELAKPGGLLESATAFLGNHVSDVKSVSEILAGGFRLYETIPGYLEDKKTAKAAGAPVPHDKLWKAGSGLSIILGFATSLLAPEKKSAVLEKEVKEDPNPGFITQVERVIQKSPTRVAAGFAIFGNNLLNGINALKARGEYHQEKHLPLAERKYPQKEFWHINMAEVLLMLVANVTFGLSSKHAGGRMQNDVLVDAVYRVAANTVAAQSKEMQEYAIQTVSDVLDKEHQINATREQIVTRLHEEVAAAAANPWTAKIRAEQAATVGLSQ